MAQAERGNILTVFAVLFAILAVSNLLKPLQLHESTGFVLFGSRLSGMPNTIAGIVAGLYLLVYAYGIWQMKRFAVGLAHAYALYVILNLLLFMYSDEAQLGLFYLLYSVVAIGVSLGSAIILTKRKTELA